MAAKQEFQNKMQARLDDLEAQIEELMAQATRSDYDEYLTNIRSKQENAKAKLAELEAAGDEAWVDHKSSVNRAVRDVENALFVMTSDLE